VIVGGVDIGSTTIKAVVIKDGQLAGWSIARTGAGGSDRALATLQQALQPLMTGKNELDYRDLDFIVATGYGRINAPFAHDTVTEITCHARAAHYLFPTTRMVIDIGGQDSKVISLDDEGLIMDFVMNDRCAAGTGRFLEVMAANLEMDLPAMSELSLKAKKGAPITSTCTVFAESEVIGLLAKGVAPQEIARGLHQSIARRISGMARKLGIRQQITMTGGVALNRGMVKALEEELMLKINVPAQPQILGAYGAALIANSRVTP